MAHELEIIDGKAQMFSGEGLTPWHGLGTVIEGLATAEKALKLAGLDWTVEKIPLTKMWNGKQVQVKDRFSVTRMTDGADLGIVSHNYHVFQNEESFNFLNAITDTDKSEAVFSTAGSLFNGARVFITLKIGDRFKVAGDDAHDLYLMVTNSHDGSQAFTASVTPIRAVCNNTVTLGLAAAKSKWSIRHKTSLEGKIADAQQSLNLSHAYEDAFKDEVERLLEIEITKDKFNSIVEKIVPESSSKSDYVDELMDIWSNEPTVYTEGSKGNGWDAFNAVTYFTDHKNYRNDVSRFKSIIGTGTGQGFAEKLRPAAHKAILQFA